MVITSIFALLMFKIAEVTLVLRLKKYLPVKWQNYLNHYLFLARNPKNKLDSVAKHTAQSFYKVSSVRVYFTAIKYKARSPNSTFKDKWQTKTLKNFFYVNQIIHYKANFFIENSIFYPVKLTPSLLNNLYNFYIYKK